MAEPVPKMIPGTRVCIVFFTNVAAIKKSLTKDILALHNELRAKADPGAANMLKMVRYFSESFRSGVPWHLNWC